jgi:hypothetical protein
MTSASDIPTAHTPPGGYGSEMPAPVLGGCTDDLAPGAPDLRGVWKVVDAYNDDGLLPAEHPIRQHVERIEQAGNRAVVTADGIIHDMVADGTYEHGVNDVMAVDFTTPIEVAAERRVGAAPPGTRRLRSAALARRRGARLALPHAVHHPERARRPMTPCAGCSSTLNRRR